ncbi:DMT family transporter [Acidihalobacter prosperus]|uniref:Permease n=1 Tax=Acidihalobacter prosperus TaxID=160660 RepID=A0A1A6C0N7_9GAMM|nr:DMT family transporter [Acidihalobacter prosperus]OBS08126.1 permease [Acidihalobacter prosperus]
MRSDILALLAILLWSGLAPLGVALHHVPPFLLTGAGLLVGSMVALPLSGFRVHGWRVPFVTLAVGAGGLFGFHFLLFMALRHAPPVQANLVNYLWPLGMVLMAPLYQPGLRFEWRHVQAGVLGFAGAAIAILSPSTATMGHSPGFQIGYAYALGSAFVWASFSLLVKRLPRYPTAAVGGFCAVAGGLALICHAWFEPAVSLSMRDWLLLATLGLGPLGSAFFLWDAALKCGDPRRIGVLAFLTPLVSTLLLVWTHHQTLTIPLVLATMMIVGAIFWVSLPFRRAAQ